MKIGKDKGRNEKIPDISERRAEASHNEQFYRNSTHLSEKLWVEREVIELFLFIIHYIAI